MTEHERIERLSEARQWALAAPLILPLLAERKRVAFDRLRANFKEGRVDNTAIVAELSVLSDLEADINYKQTIFNTMENRS